MNSNSPHLPLMLGCPVWGCADWGGQVYPQKTPRSQWLQWYSRTFNTVEGNSTFYALPSIETTRRWASETANGFRFMLKFPRSISHDNELEGCQAETNTFVRCLEPLAESDRLGPTFLQLGPNFGPDRFEALSQYLTALPRGFQWAVEVRHLDWFDSGSHEGRLNELLRGLNIDKVLFDSRPLFATPPDDEIETRSQVRKPRTPIRQTTTGKHPVLRLVGRNRIELVNRFFDQWAPIVAKWIRDGLCPYVFTHAPDDRYAPSLARQFSSRLQQEFPNSSWQIPLPPSTPKQLSLLGDF
ncbi:MAG: DUF72 domain-containing protein [Rubripirellula sp.]|nr:DUF72 domain-containing protein [Rubripirellula sp.]